MPINLVTLLSSWTNQLTINVAPKESSNHVSDLEQNSSIKSSDNQVPRVKRAVGLLLQGLVQALGYNTTPIQIATLSNGNNGDIPLTSPLNVDSRILNQSPVEAQNSNGNNSPSISSSNSRPRETLRFTGVVNFGNNSDLSSHLRQYEILFHGMPTASSSVITPALSTITPNIATSGPNPPSIPLPTAFPNLSAPIPIPLLQNLRYPKPLLSIVTTPPMIIFPTSVSGQNTENTTIHNAPIRNEHSTKDDNDENVGEESYEDEDEAQDNYQGEEEYNDDETKIVGQSDKEDLVNDNREEDDEGNSEVQVSNQSNKYNSHDTESKKSALRENAGNYEDSDDDDDDDDDDEEPFKYSRFTMPNNKYLMNSDTSFSVKLPLDNKPFHGQLMNSYGQSLEHGGKIDESVADYFAKFKNPHSGVFELPRMDMFKNYRQQLSGENYREPLINKQTSQNYPNSPYVGFKYEEYKLNDDHKPSRLREESLTKVQDNIQLQQSDEQNNRDMSHGNILNYPQLSEFMKTNSGGELSIRPFDFHKFKPYYKPVQYIYTPESSETATQKIIPYPEHANNYTETDNEDVKESKTPKEYLISRTRNLDDQMPSLPINEHDDYIHTDRRTTIQPDKYDMY
ncbi:hypothetical protein PV327_006901 [Microctonus hyperodae]|uniref:Uncharacterized protein n=1 Tax=Microctonus hyperodae TaxID=165561 RepID=A0AA39KIX3_MICHY|nr:hypothetical protein PV327_006901 [Microctonus hyperodae]